MNKKRILLFGALALASAASTLQASASMRAVFARVLQKVQARPSVQQVTRTAQTAWKSKPMDSVKKATMAVVNNPIKFVAASALASQGYLYAHVQMTAPDGRTLPVSIEKGALEALRFDGKTRFLPQTIKRKIKHNLERSGVTGIVVVTVGEATKAPLPILACDTSKALIETPFSSSEKECYMLILDPLALNFLQGKVATIRIDGDSSQIYDKDGVLSVIHHEAAHMVLKHHALKNELDAKIHAVTDVTLSLQKLGACASMVAGLYRYNKGTFSFPRLVGRNALLVAVLHGFDFGMKASTMFIERLASRNCEWQADKRTCYSTTLDELEAYRNVRSIWSQIHNAIDSEGDEDDEKVKLPKFFKKALSTHPTEAERVVFIDQELIRRKAVEPALEPTYALDIPQEMLDSLSDEQREELSQLMELIKALEPNDQE